MRFEPKLSVMTDFILSWFVSHQWFSAQGGKRKNLLSLGVIAKHWVRACTAHSLI